MNRIATQFTLLISFFIIALSIAGHAQSKSGNISGTLKTSDGKAAGYVSVSLKNTKHSTHTDEKGEFTLTNIKPGSYVLKISSVGVSAQEQPITVSAGQTSDLNLAISESSSALNEVAINGYKTPNQKAVNLGKIAIAPKDLPQSVQIIGSQVIADQQANRLSDVLKNVNGVAYGENRGSVSGETFFARGYSLGTNNVFKNGSRASSGGMPETSTLESVEVLKGSAALLYGGVTGGAVVNMVTKKPKFEYGGEVSLRAGSYGLIKPTVDVFGPISNKLAFRLIGTYEDADSFRDHVQSKRRYINPSLLYKISDKTEVLLQGDYLKSDFTPDFGIGTIANKISNLPRNAYVNTPWAYNKTNTVTSQLNVNHKFNAHWKLNALANFQSYNRNYYSAERPFADAAGIALRNLTRAKTKEFTYNEQINLNGTFKTGKINHALLVGADADQSKITSNVFAYPGNVTPYNYGSINLNDPSTFNTRTDIPEVTNTLRIVAPVYRMGVFVQDLISLTEHVKFLAGIRYTAQRTAALDTAILNTENHLIGKKKTESAFSPKLGLVYQPLKSTSVYLSYASNFISNTGTDIYKAPLSPSTVDQYEAGIKNDLLEGKLSLNITAYMIKNNNYAQTAVLDAAGNPNADSNIKEFNGKSKSDGLEIDVTGTIVKGLNFIAGYSYNFMRYTETRDRQIVVTPAPTATNPNATKETLVGGTVEGQRLVGTTKNTANATLFYTMQDGTLKGLKLGASAYYTGKRNGGYNDTKIQTASRLIPLTAFTTVDLSAGYNWNKLSLLVKLSNITNELNYFVHENYSVNPIPPRQVMGTLSYKF